jgi:asparaginyl-tRNA synthetase
LSEYTHPEAELAFITFEDLMTHIETVVRPPLFMFNLPTLNPPTTPTQICETISALLSSPPTAALIHTLNPTFKPPTRPFARLSYPATIKWLNEHSITRPATDASSNPIVDSTTGQAQMVPHEDGDDIAAAAERQMTDLIRTPVFLYGFPTHLKAFYMKKVPGSEGHTESCDLLMPGVGDILGT